MSVIPKKGIVVDGSTMGNPGLSEYRGLDLETGEIVFKQNIGITTNNICEFLALVHALAHAKKNGLGVYVYSDSQTAISWVKNRKCNSSLECNNNTKYAYDLVNRAERWLRVNHHSVKGIYLKWETKSWGENPADYGRK